MSSTTKRTGTSGGSGSASGGSAYFVGRPSLYAAAINFLRQEVGSTGLVDALRADLEAAPTAYDAFRTIVQRGCLGFAASKAWAVFLHQAAAEPRGGDAPVGPGERLDLARAVDLVHKIYDLAAQAEVADFFPEAEGSEDEDEGDGDEDGDGDGDGAGAGGSP